MTTKYIIQVKVDFIWKDWSVRYIKRREAIVAFKRTISEITEADKKATNIQAFRLVKVTEILYCEV